MKRTKRFLMTLALLLGISTGAWAAEVTIGDPTSTSPTLYGFLPSYSANCYSLSQQIYTADEIGMSGTITALTMWLKNTSNYARNFNIYMKEVDKTVFESNTDWVSMTADDLVATGTLNNGISSFTATTFTLTSPFVYSGKGNLVICFADVTGNWSSGAYSNTMTASGNQAIYAYQDENTYNVTNPGTANGRQTAKSVVRLEIEPATAVAWNYAAKTGTFAMPAGNVTLTPVYAPVAKWATDGNKVLTPAAADGSIYAGTDAALVTAGTVASIGSTESKQGTVMYYAAQSDTDTPPTAPDYDAAGWSEGVPTAENFAAGDVYVWYYIKGIDAPEGEDPTEENTFSDSDISATALTVTLLSDKFDIILNAANANTIEAGKATVTVGGTAATPTSGKIQQVKMGSEVKVSAKEGYKFRKVEAKKAVPVNTVDLSTLDGNYEAQDGDVLSGTLGGNYKISIADGATVTLSDLTISGMSSSRYKWAGITCAGDATIILTGENSVNGFYSDYPGIHVPTGSTLTIQGSGSLTASSNGYGAGIGSGFYIACGNIVIEGGTITATGGQHSAGIGSSYNAPCGAITITGGTITATGGSNAAGIGTGYASAGSNSCGAITIANTVTSVTATKGSNAPNSIGKGTTGQGGTNTCGTITIGGVVYSDGISESPYIYQQP